MAQTATTTALNERNAVQESLTNTIADLTAETALKVSALADLASEQGVSSGLQTELTTALEEKSVLETDLATETASKEEAELSLSNANSDLSQIETFLEETTTTTTNLTSQLTTETDSLVAALEPFGYNPPASSDFSGFVGNGLVDAVRRAGAVRRDYLNFKGKVVENDFRKSTVANSQLNFRAKAKPRKQVSFRADGGQDFSTKYGALGKIGLIGGLIYLLTKK